MQHLTNVSAQTVSWVKSNKAALEQHGDAIKHLYYPETTDELITLVTGLYASGARFDVIGYASNTLFLPSYAIDHLICTKKLDQWQVTAETVVCACGVPVAALAKAMVKQGYEGFYGLVDLPGTVAAAVYGNAGCFDCSVNELLAYVTLLTPDGERKRLTAADLKLGFRTSALKRKERTGVIVEVALRLVRGDAREETRKSANAHAKRVRTQPPTANNLGSTFNASTLTLKGILIKLLGRLYVGADQSKVFKKVFPLFGGGQYVPYLDTWDRYLFSDAHAHDLFPAYIRYFNTLYVDARLEIELKQ